MLQKSNSDAEDVLIAVVIPCYKVRKNILKVLEDIGSEVDMIYVVDDACPEQSGDLVQQTVHDPRVKVLRNAENQGVGGTVIVGYRAALEAGAQVIVKVDGDGQMDPRLIGCFLAPILAGAADYTKGNRFYYLDKIHAMPKARLFGNAFLSFFTKLSSGYWDIFDPTNGYTAIHVRALNALPLEKISKRYFFETDMLFRLNTIRAVVVDVPMHARYADENSSLKILKVIPEFFVKNVKNFGKRIFYNYYLRDMSVASIELPLGILLLLFGFIFGVTKWIESISSDLPSSAGTVMLSALPVITGLQLILSFLNYDIRSVPYRTYHLLGAKRHQVANTSSK